MSPLMVTLRLLHIVLGVFWAGTLIFFATYLVPSVREVGPDGVKVMGAIQRRRFLDVMPAVAAVTMLSGLWLYWRLSGGFNWNWVISSMGLALGTGGVLSIIAFTIGVAVMRPATLRAGAISRQMASVPEGPERDNLQQQVKRLRMRSANAGRTVAVLLFGTTALMAVARYL
jgi:hypothetical protein